MDYNERMNDQEHIKLFTDNIFNAGHAGCEAKRMNYKQFEYINKTISSEMFYSLMAILHEKLPCSKNHFRLKRKYRENLAEQNGEECQSPVKIIASPNIIKGLGISKKMSSDVSSVSPKKKSGEIGSLGNSPS